MSATRRSLSATTGPRKVGTVTTSAFGAMALTEDRKRASSSFGISSAKKLGARFGIVFSIAELRLVWIVASVANSVNPSPNATTSRPVCAPGR